MVLKNEGADDGPEDSTEEGDGSGIEEEATDEDSKGEDDEGAVGIIVELEVS